MTTPLRSPQVVMDALKSVRFVIERDGQQSGVFLDISDWETLLDWLEELEDRALVQSILPHLQQGPEKAGALRWEKVEMEWSDETA